MDIATYMCNRQFQITCPNWNSWSMPQPALPPQICTPLHLSKLHQHLPNNSSQKPSCHPWCLLVFNFRAMVTDFMKTTFNIFLPFQDNGTTELKKGSLITWCGAFVVFPEHFLWGGVEVVEEGLGKELKQYDQIALLDILGVHNKRCWNIFVLQNQRQCP